LTSQSGDTEQKLYENIVEIPQYENNWLQLIDREDEIVIVENSFA
jgi:hypothetical protein